ncbi:MAG: aldose 1-epimerase [Sediminibacterium sp.]
MSFDLKIQAQKNSIQLIDLHNGTMIEIHCKGALMNRWIVLSDNHPLELIIGNTGVENFEMNGFRSGKMSPFSCRIDKGKYHWDHQEFEFKKFYLGEHAMHGLIYDANFSILRTKVNENFAEVTLSFNYQGTDLGFPYPYEIIVQWTLYEDNRIGLKTTIVNHSNYRIPIMDGWHPYFTLGGQVNDYTLEFQSNGRLEMRDDMIPTGSIMEDTNYNTGKKIGDTHFDDCHLLHPKHQEIKISYKGMSILVQSKHNYPYLQLYTPNDRKSIAIENLSGAPNCFNNKMGLQQLEPQGQIYFETTYHFSAASPQ